MRILECVHFYSEQDETMRRVVSCKEEQRSSGLKGVCYKQAVSGSTGIIVAGRPRKSGDLRRKAPKRKPYNRILIVCEGEKTEPMYFKDLRDHYRLNTADIAITSANGSDPVSLVRYAKKMQENEKNQREKFDKIYCVFDRDDHTNFKAACDQLKANGFKPARSWPCFEYWLLLHFGYQRSPFSARPGQTAAQNCQSALKKKLPAYSKGMKGVFNKLSSRLDDGIKNSAKAKKDAEKTNNKDPSTEVHLLVKELQDLKSEQG